MNMALFKFPEVEPNSATAIQRIVDSMHFGSLLEVLGWHLQVLQC